jgi:hypothetical protein
MATVTTMPARGHATAPKFSPDQPRELRRFFKELEYLFTNAGVTNDDEKKPYAVRYMDADVADLWESIAEFSAGSYDDFKKAIHGLYPGSEEERKWNMADMDKLVGEQLRIGIYSVADFGTYYRSFIQITKFLIDKIRLSEKEQARAFIRGIQPALWQRITTRLEIKKPDKHPDDPYDLQDIRSAAEYVLYDPNISTHVSRPTPSVTSPSSATVTSSPDIKQEDLNATLRVFLQALEKTLEKGLAQQPSSNPLPNHQQVISQSPRNSNCFMCSEPGHGVKDCEVTKEMIRIGKCIINAQGRISLPNGQYVPNAIIGKDLRERINEWHRRNPGQTITVPTSLMYSVTPKQTVTSTVFLGGATSTSPDLTELEQIQVLERQIMALRSGKKFDGVEIIRRQPREAQQPLPVIPAQAISQPITPTQPANTSHEQPTANKAIQAPSNNTVTPSTSAVPPPINVVPPTNTPSTTAPVDNIVNAPTHPFAPKRANYLPPQDKNFAVPIKADPAYKTVAPVQSPKIVEEVYNRSMDTSCVTLTPNELLAISAEIRQKFREAITPKRQAPSNPTVVNIAQIQSPQNQSPLPFATIEEIEECARSIPAFSPPTDGIVIPDFYETYLNRLAPGQTPEVFTVARESHALRAINLHVNNKNSVEAILDPGCMIVAMSEAVCMSLSVIYDPSIVINMQSANGETDPTLGLARNVRCTVGEIVLYLQFHVIRSPAYDILLGRPFDVLTESMVKNYANEDQTITICDPNFDRRITIPTIIRGPPQYTTLSKPSQDFRILAA